jgi:hypothetical protein
MLASALLAAVAFLLIFWRYEQIFFAPEEITMMTQVTPEADAEMRRVRAWNWMYGYALFGGILSAALSATEGAARRSLIRLLAGLVVGALLGALFGWGAGYAASVIYSGNFLEVDPMIRTMLFQACAWVVLGIGVGLATAAPAGSMRVIGKAVLGAVLGGLISAMLYPILAAYLFPTDHSDRVVPAGLGNRLFWVGLTSGLMGLLLGWQGSTLPETSSPEYR